MNVFNLALPTREEDHNWCPWIIAQVATEDPTADNATIDAIVARVTVVDGQDDGDIPATIVALTNSFIAAGFVVNFIAEGRLHWMDL